MRTQTVIVDDESWIQFLLGLNFMTDGYSARPVSRITKHVEPILSCDLFCIASDTRDVSKTACWAWRDGKFPMLGELVC